MLILLVVSLVVVAELWAVCSVLAYRIQMIYFLMEFPENFFTLPEQGLEWRDEWWTRTRWAIIEESLLGPLSLLLACVEGYRGIVFPSREEVRQQASLYWEKIRGNVTNRP